MNKKVYILIAGALMLFSACTGPGTGPDKSQLTLSDSGKIMPMEDLNYDWGDINIEGGMVSHTFKLKNDGTEDLIVKRATTSCMCTTATIQDSSENLSPQFGMHGSSTWGQPIAPGEEFTVDVVFDPMAHGPQAVGPIQRSVYIETSSVANGNYAQSSPDGKSSITELRVSGDVMFKEDYDKKKN